jgi:hypothetical protein
MKSGRGQAQMTAEPNRNNFLKPPMQCRLASTLILSKRQPELL